MSAVGSPAVQVPDDPVWREDLLGRVGRPFHLRNGVDVIAAGRPDRGVGIVVYLQNPFAKETTVYLEMGPKEFGGSERIELTLMALEVLLLDLPMTVSPGDKLKLTIGSTMELGVERIRTSTPGKLDIRGSIPGIAGGLATLLLTPVGHFSWARNGGDVANPLVLEPTIKGNYRSSHPVTARRLLALPGDPRPDVLIYRRVAGGREIRWTRAFGTGICLLGSLPLALTAIAILPAYPTLGNGLFAVVMSIVSLALLNAIVFKSWLVRDRLSRFGASGPGVADGRALA